MKLLAPTSIIFTTNKGLQRKSAFPQDWLTINQEAGEAGEGCYLRMALVGIYHQGPSILTILQ